LIQQRKKSTYVFWPILAPKTEKGVFQAENEKFRIWLSWQKKFPWNFAYNRPGLEKIWEKSAFSKFFDIFQKIRQKSKFSDFAESWWKC